MLARVCVAVLAFAAGAPEGSPLPAASSLPEIGRTRSVSPPCVVMRDVVIPSFAAAQRADAQFAQARIRLPRYGELAAEYANQRGAVRSGGVNLEGELMKLGVDAAKLSQEAETIRKLLADPRISAESTDASVQAERAQLEQLYAMQQARANLLNEFVSRESVSLARQGVGMEDSGGVRPRMPVPTANANAGPMPVPAVTAAPGMPLITQIEGHNRARLDEWGAGVAKAVRESENQAARTFLAVAQQCR